MVCARGIIIAASSGVREGIVCVVYLLEFPCAGGTFRGVCRDSVWVCLESCSWDCLVGACNGRDCERTSYRHHGLAAV